MTDKKKLTIYKTPAIEQVFTGRPNQPASARISQVCERYALIVDSCLPSIDESIIEVLREDLGREPLYSCIVKELEHYVSDYMYDTIKKLSIMEKIALVEYLGL